MKAIIMNKRIILALGMMVFVAAVLISSTGAFFSDTESSTGNVFTAGAIDLKIDSTATYNGNAVESATWTERDLNPTADKFFNFNDIKPGDHGTNTVSVHVINNDAWVCAYVTGLTENENGINEPESEVDSSPTGELRQNMNWVIWRDTNGNGVQDVGEGTLTSGQPNNGVLALYDSTTGTGPLSASTTGYIGVAWTLPATVGNEVQTDVMTGDISFHAVQSRNNLQYKCVDTPIASPDDVAVTNGDLSPTGWLFYNDTNDTVMTPNQFSATGGANEITAMTGSNGAAYMKLDAGTKSPDYDGTGDAGNPRYNIATYQFKNVKLADISTIKYRTYDASASAETAYLNFNVDFDNSDTWQRRLVQIPTGITANTWTEVDAKAGMWSLSGGNWPVGVNTAVPFAGSTLRTWADIIADYPNAETRSTDSFFGIRVGHPGPIGEEGYVDWVEFDGVKYDFEI